MIGYSGLNDALGTSCDGYVFFKNPRNRERREMILSGKKIAEYAGNQKKTIPAQPYKTG